MNSAKAPLGYVSDVDGVRNMPMNQQPATTADTDAFAVDDYHQRSKHNLQKYAQGPDGLDWDTQPNPFRQFEGCSRFSLPLPARNLVTNFNTIYLPESTSAHNLDLTTLGALFELSLGLSAWKVYGADRWALRINPSSGNLHPTEAYLVFAGTGILPAGVYHYQSQDHSLELRCNLNSRDDAFATLSASNSFIIGLSSVHWREAWKYGERGWRYCQHDIGHAVGAIRYAAAVLGWRLELLEHCSDAQTATLLGLNRETDFDQAETETPDVLLRIVTSNSVDTPDIRPLIKTAAAAVWNGRANTLSPDNRIHWDAIEKITASCTKPETPTQHWTPNDYPALTECNTSYDASAIIRHRRSAQAFDANTVLPLAKFYRMLDTLLVRTDTAPFDALPWQPRIHLVLFVHRIEGLKPGLYVFPRSDAGQALLKQKLRSEFDWSRPPICPDTLPLYHLVSARCQNAAKTVSCHQAIASDSAFSISMLAEYENTVSDKPWQYRQLFWEAGLIGQCLYLEAEAAGIRGTGIGCYFDDAVHELLGIQDKTLQTIYHFTVGTPVQDTRLISLPPYGK